MTWKFEDRDEFQRKSIAEKIIKLLDAPVDISPMVIDGTWGTGKTEFSQKLYSYISEGSNDKQVIYIDAFKEDHCEDALLTITSAIAKELPEKEKQALIQKMIPAVKFGLKTFFKAGAGWILKQDADILADEFHDAVKDASNAAIDGTIENLITEHMEAENNINALKEKLKELASIKKLVIIIDELDRCRPTYSVQLLEKVKHIFDIPNVTILLVTNLEQLKAAIHHSYGSTIDSQNYLEKFIKYTVSLPPHSKPDGYTKKETAIIHWQTLANNDTSLSKFATDYFPSIKELLLVKPLSLREVETLFRYFKIYQSLTDDSLSRGMNFPCALIKMIGIYLYCFGDRRSLAIFPSRETLHSTVNALGIQRFTIDPDNTSGIPNTLVILDLILKESKLDLTVFTPLKQEEKKALDDRSKELDRLGFTISNYTNLLKDVFETLSLV